MSPLKNVEKFVSALKIFLVWLLEYSFARVYPEKHPQQQTLKQQKHTFISHKAPSISLSLSLSLSHTQHTHTHTHTHSLSLFHNQHTLLQTHTHTHFPHPKHTPQANQNETNTRGIKEKVKTSTH